MHSQPVLLKEDQLTKLGELLALRQRLYKVYKEVELSRHCEADIRIKLFNQMNVVPAHLDDVAIVSNINKRGRELVLESYEMAIGSINRQLRELGIEPIEGA